jgi:hypothetical protein
MQWQTENRTKWQTFKYINHDTGNYRVSNRGILRCPGRVISCCCTSDTRHVTNHYNNLRLLISNTLELIGSWSWPDADLQLLVCKPCGNLALKKIWYLCLSTVLSNPMSCSFLSKYHVYRTKDKTKHDFHKTQIVIMSNSTMNDWQSILCWFLGDEWAPSVPGEMVILSKHLNSRFVMFIFPDSIYTFGIFKPLFIVKNKPES